MGMDLVARADGVEGFHFNWAGWSMICTLLDDLGADLSEVSGFNDGEFVSAATASAWAALLSGALANGSIINESYPDSRYAGGMRTLLRERSRQAAEPAVADDRTDTELENEHLVELLSDSTLLAGLPDSLRHEVQQRVRTSPGADVTLSDLDDDDLRWLDGFVTFLSTCDGFYQY